jgi:hypothetical protein
MHPSNIAFIFGPSKSYPGRSRYHHSADDLTFSVLEFAVPFAAYPTVQAQVVLCFQVSRRDQLRSWHGNWTGCPSRRCWRYLGAESNGIWVR